ncbi:MAG: RNA polymerase sigma factor [Candidatus Eisenbacteria bacterium]
MERLTDEQWMERLRKGDGRSLEELYRRHSRTLYAFCAHAAPAAGVHDPEDLVHDVFLRLVQRASSFDPARASFKTWLFRIARNQCIDLVRRGGRVRFVRFERGGEAERGGARPAPENAVADPAPLADTIMEKNAMIRALGDCVREIEHPEEKDALLLYYLHEKVLEEIARIIGRSTSTVKNRLDSARAKIKGCLERKGISGTP